MEEVGVKCGCMQQRNTHTGRWSVPPLDKKGGIVHFGNLKFDDVLVSARFADSLRTSAVLC